MICMHRLTPPTCCMSKYIVTFRLRGTPNISNSLHGIMITGNHSQPTLLSTTAIQPPSSQSTNLSHLSQDHHDLSSHTNTTNPVVYSPTREKPNPKPKTYPNPTIPSSDEKRLRTTRLHSTHNLQPHNSHFYYLLHYSRINLTTIRGKWPYTTNN